jgi:uncharacterized protein YjiS (DUF1127 family)
MINLLDTWRQQRRIANTRRHLNGLSDHILADIGLTRSDIASVGQQGPARGRRGR